MCVVDTWYNDNKIIIANYGAPELYFPVTSTLHIHLKDTFGYHLRVVVFLSVMSCCYVYVPTYRSNTKRWKGKKIAIILIVHQCIYKIIIIMGTVVPVSMDIYKTAILLFIEKFYDFFSSGYCFFSGFL